MAAERWSNDGTECISLRLVRSTQGDESTCPILFCYPLFGEAQVIYGCVRRRSVVIWTFLMRPSYENLDIQLAFASGSLASYLSVTYDAKMPSTSSVKPDDVEGTFYKWLPADYLKDEAAFDARVEQDTREFRPYGQRIASYARRVVAPAAATNGKGKGKATVTDDSDDHDEGDEPREQWEDCAADAEGAIVYEVWHVRARPGPAAGIDGRTRQATMATPGFRTYLRRMQIFVPLYIEGGEYIDEEDDRWEFVILCVSPGRAGELAHTGAATSGDHETVMPLPITLSASRTSTVRRHAYAFGASPRSDSLPLLAQLDPHATSVRWCEAVDGTAEQACRQFIILPPFQGAGHGCASGLAVYSACPHRRAQRASTRPSTSGCSLGQRSPNSPVRDPGRASDTRAHARSQSRTPQRRSKTCATKPTSAPSSRATL
jgi:hypothetical protein